MVNDTTVGLSSLEIQRRSIQTVVRLFDNAIENNENVIKTYKRLNQEDPLVRENLARLVLKVYCMEVLFGFLGRY